MTESSYDRLSRDPEMRRLLAQEQLMLEVSESILEEMERLDVTQAELAERLGKTRGFVSQLLSGERNMTLRTLADLCWGVGVVPSLDLTTATAESLSLSVPAGEES